MNNMKRYIICSPWEIREHPEGNLVKYSEVSEEMKRMCEILRDTMDDINKLRYQRRGLRSNTEEVNRLQEENKRLQIDVDTLDNEVNVLATKLAYYEDTLCLSNSRIALRGKHDSVVDAYPINAEKLRIVLEEREAYKEELKNLREELRIEKQAAKWAEDWGKTAEKDIPVLLEVLKAAKEVREWNCYEVRDMNKERVLWANLRAAIKKYEDSK